ncbi:MAG TPA: RidA family protein [Steroidobacteraceae bacterium]
MKLIIRLAAVAAVILAPSALMAAEHGEHGPDFIVLDDSPARAKFPFSDAVRAGNTLYVAGTIGVDPKSQNDPKGPRVPDDAATEAKLAMQEIQHVVETAGFTMDQVVSVQVYCTDLDLYGAFNDVYRTFFHGHFPARAFIGVNKLVLGAHFEVMATAVKPRR